MLAQFIYDNENWFYEKKIQNFFKIFFNFFQFFGHPSHTKRFFCTFGPKITYSYILGGQHVHLTPKKCFLEAHSTKCPWNAPPRKYPDISEPVQGRVNCLLTQLPAHFPMSLPGVWGNNFNPIHHYIAHIYGLSINSHKYIHWNSSYKLTLIYFHSSFPIWLWRSKHLV